MLLFVTFISTVYWSRVPSPLPLTCIFEGLVFWGAFPTLQDTSPPSGSLIAPEFLSRRMAVFVAIGLVRLFPVSCSSVPQCLLIQFSGVNLNQVAVESILNVPIGTTAVLTFYPWVFLLVFHFSCGPKTGRRCTVYKLGVQGDVPVLFGPSPTSF